MSTCNITTQIPESQCIGDSLITINTNFDKLDTAVCDLSSQTLSAVSTSSIALSFNTSNRVIQASIKSNSITSDMISPAFTLSASQVVTPPTGIKRFRENYGGNTSGTFYRMNTYIGYDNNLYAAGYGNGYLINGKNSEYLNAGFHKIMIPFEAGEYAVKHYMSGGGNPAMYVLSNLGNLWSTGYNGWYQMGDSTGTDRQVFQKVPELTAGVADFSVAASESSSVNHCLAATKDGKLYAWGYNGNGQLGLGNTTTNPSKPTLISGGGIANKFIKKVFAFGDDYTSYGNSFVIDSDDNVYSCGINGSGQLGLNNTATTSLFTNVYGAIKGDYVICRNWNSGGTSYIVRNNILYACGDNGYGQLGNGTTTSSTLFTNLLNLPVKSVTMCSYYCGTVCALLTDGTIRTWGWNGYGQLGDGTTTNRSTPYNPGLTNIKKVVSIDYSYPTIWALSNTGVVFGAGYNGYGQIGDGTDTQRNSFTRAIKPADLLITDMEAWGRNSGTGLTMIGNDGNIYSLGYNGQHCTGVPYTDPNSRSWMGLMQRAVVQ